MISLAELIGDQLYQVNLVISMLQPSKNASVKPLLFEAGFRLNNIEKPLAFTPEMCNRLETDGFSTSNPVTPDIILESGSKQFVIFECKKTMFGSVPNKNASPIKQARACLLQIPEVLSRGLAVQESDVLSSSLVYLSRHDPEVQQTDGLKEISDNLKAKNYKTIEFGLLGLSHDDSNIYLNKNYLHAVLPNNLNNLLKDSPTVVQELTHPNEDPRGYYFIPWMPGNKDDYSENAFGNAVLQETTIIIAKKRPPDNVTLKLEDIINLATNGAYEKWRNPDIRKQLIRNTRQLIKGIFKLVAAELSIKHTDDGKSLEIYLPDEKVQFAIIEAMRKWKSQQWTDAVQPGLFD